MTCESWQRLWGGSSRLSFALQQPHQIELGTGMAHRGDRRGDLPAVVRAVVEHVAQRDGEGQRLRDALGADVFDRPTPASGVQRLDEGLPTQRALDQT